MSIKTGNGKKLTVVKSLIRLYSAWTNLVDLDGFQDGDLKKKKNLRKKTKTNNHFVLNQSSGAFLQDESGRRVYALSVSRLYLLNNFNLKIIISVK